MAVMMLENKVQRRQVLKRIGGSAIAAAAGMMPLPSIAQSAPLKLEFWLRELAPQPILGRTVFVQLNGRSLRLIRPAGSAVARSNLWSKRKLTPRKP